MENERNTDFVASDMEKKLILLFIFERMEFPLTEASIGEIIVANDSWMNYMDFRDALYTLISQKFIQRSSAGSDTLFAMTMAGKAALGHFYTKIPASIREEVTAFAAQHKQRFKRNQEYTYDYFKNQDGSHTVLMKVREQVSSDNILEVRLKVENRTSAVRAAARWKERAPIVYEALQNILLDD